MSEMRKTEAFSRRRMGLLLLLACGIVYALILAEVWRLSGETGLARMRQTAEATAEARATALAAMVARERSVTAILADDRDVRSALAGRGGGNTPSVPAVDISWKFARLLDPAGSSVLYLIDAEGTAIAASNWQAEDSFVGSNYRFRSYFSGAMARGQGTEYALGSVSNRPGLYISDRVAGPAAGVVVAKVEFAPLEASWRAGGGRSFVTDAAGLVMMTSDPALRFSRVPEPGEALRIERPVPGTPWHFRLDLPTAPVRAEAVWNTVLAGLAMLPVGFVLLLLWRRREQAQRRRQAERDRREELERVVTERTGALSAEIRERRAAEERLAAMQGRLVQANRLAALGQITAGVAHEVNQPLATIRLLAENARAMLPQPEHLGDVDGNLAQIVRMSERIDTITSELRGFSRKARSGQEPVSLAEAWDASLLLAASRRTADRVRVVIAAIPPGLKVVAEKVRLEQVFVNLLQNAHEALTGREGAEIRISIDHRPDAEGQDWVTCTVADNGPGISPEVAENLFSPFLTTKPAGLGLGLVISQEIVREMGGRLWADPPRPGEGARFHVELRRAE